MQGEMTDSDVQRKSERVRTRLLVGDSSVEDDIYAHKRSFLVFFSLVSIII